MRYDPHAAGRFRGSKSAVAVPLRGQHAGARRCRARLIGLQGDALSFDFKWGDNPADLKDPISPMHRRRQRPEPPLQLPLHLEKVSRPRPASPQHAITEFKRERG